MLTNNAVGVFIGFQLGDTSTAILRDNEITNNGTGVVMFGGTALLEGYYMTAADGGLAGLLAVIDEF